MELSNTANSQGIIQDIDFLCGTNSSTYPTVDKIRNINQEYHNVTRLIWESCDYWQYDDSNQTNLPVAYTTLVEIQQDYEIPSTAQRIHRVEVKNAAGDWVKLMPRDYKDINIAMPEYFETAGMPQYYDLVGRSLFLYPKPTSTYVTLTSGAAIYVDRDITEFTTASTTTVPGFAPQFHRILSLQAAIDFESDFNKTKLLLSQKENLINGLKKFYSSRGIEQRAEIRPSSKKIHRQYE